MQGAENGIGAEASAPRRGRPNLPSHSLTVVKSEDASGNMRRVTFALPADAVFEYKPGQAIVMMIPLGDGEFGRRDYTIRSFDRAARTLAVDFLKHGDTPAPRWAISAQPGEVIEVKGPRGHTHLDPDVDWHFFTGDETCIPAIAHILESAPADTRVHALIEVQDESGVVEIITKANLDLHWLHRKTLPAGPGTFMADALASFALPGGHGRAYIIGETSNVRRQRHDLIARGLTREQIRSEGYWRPGRIGGHDHVDD